MAQCRYCKETIVLNEDSPEARAARTDPHQQMRRHILQKHTVLEAVAHTRKLGWLIDMLWFDSPDKPENYRLAARNLLEFYIDGDGLK
jgi:hypothetical protein